MHILEVESFARLVEIALLDLDKLDVKDKGRVSGKTRKLLVAVSELGWASETTLSTDLHALDTLIPALDDFALTKLEVERLAAGALVEDLAVGELADVAHADLLAGLASGTVTLALLLDDETGGELGGGHLGSRLLDSLLLDGFGLGLGILGALCLLLDFGLGDLGRGGGGGSSSGIGLELFGSGFLNGLVSGALLGLGRGRSGLDGLLGLGSRRFDELFEAVRVLLHVLVVVILKVVLVELARVESVHVLLVILVAGIELVVGRLLVVIVGRGNVVTDEVNGSITSDGEADELFLAELEVYNGMILVGGVEAAESINLLLNLVLVLGLGLILLILIVFILEAGNVSVVDLDKSLGAALGLLCVRDVSDLEVTRNVHAVDLARDELEAEEADRSSSHLVQIKQWMRDRRDGIRV